MKTASICALISSLSGPFILIFFFFFFNDDFCVRYHTSKQAEKRTDLQEFRSRGVIGEQIQSPLNDVGAGAASLVVFRLLPFAEDLDGGKTSDLHKAHT